MKTPRTLAIGLSALIGAVAAPAYAAPGYVDEAFAVARNERGVTPAPLDPEWERARAKRKAERKPEPTDEAPGYGYGYERRQIDAPEPRDVRPAPREFRGRR
jgi:hypothetical protein